VHPRGDVSRPHNNTRGQGRRHRSRVSSGERKTS
jgi:hypothetical protein